MSSLVVKDSDALPDRREQSLEFQGPESNTLAA